LDLDKLYLEYFFQDFCTEDEDGKLSRSPIEEVYRIDRLRSGIREKGRTIHIFAAVMFAFGFVNLIMWLKIIPGFVEQDMSITKWEIKWEKNGEGDGMYWKCANMDECKAETVTSAPWIFYTMTTTVAVEFNHWSARTGVDSGSLDERAWQYRSLAIWIAFLVMPWCILRYYYSDCFSPFQCPELHVGPQILGGVVACGCFNTVVLMSISGLRLKPFAIAQNLQGLMILGVLLPSYNTVGLWPVLCMFCQNVICGLVKFNIDAESRNNYRRKLRLIKKGEDAEIGLSAAPTFTAGKNHNVPLSTPC